MDTLDRGTVGQTVRIAAVQGDKNTYLEDALRRRLLELGFLPGTAVEILRTGDPMVVRLRGYNVTLPLSHAARLTVNKL